jgi:D-proline reductase (dithiol) PrdB
VGLIQRTIEEHGIATVSVSLNLAITRKVRPPRALYPGFTLGHPMGRAHDRELQTRVLRDSLVLLETALGPGEVAIKSYETAREGSEPALSSR